MSAAASPGDGQETSSPTPDHVPALLYRILAARLSAHELAEGEDPASKRHPVRLESTSVPRGSGVPRYKAPGRSVGP